MVSGIWKKRIHIFLASFFCLVSTLAFGSAFQLQEQSVPNMGIGFAGTAAIADDAATNWYNPAGLTELSGCQATVGGFGIFPSGKLNVDEATSTYNARLQPAVVKLNGDAFVPYFHAAVPCNDCLAFGLSMVTPFGLKTKYNEHSVARYMATLSELKTVNTAFGAAYKIADCLSIGAAIDVLYAKAKLNAQFGAGGNLPDGFTRNTASDWAVSWHAGVLYKFCPETRVGLSYFHKYSLKLTGHLDEFVATPLQPVLPNPAGGRFNAKTNLTLPEVVRLSGYHTFDKCWAAVAEVQFTRWNRLKSVTIEYPDGTVIPGSSRTRSLIFDYKNAWRVAVGGIYTYDPCWQLRGGFAWDQSPTRDEHRTIRVPDNDRLWLTAGVKWQFNKCMAFDLAYAHVFNRRSNIDERGPLGANGQPTGQQTLVGQYKSSADLIGVQFTYSFV